MLDLKSLDPANEVGQNFYKCVKSQHIGTSVNNQLIWGLTLVPHYIDEDNGGIDVLYEEIANNGSEYIELMDDLVEGAFYTADFANKYSWTDEIDDDDTPLRIRAVAAGVEIPPCNQESSTDE